MSTRDDFMDGDRPPVRSRSKTFNSFALRSQIQRRRRHLGAALARAADRGDRSAAEHIRSLGGTP